MDREELEQWLEGRSREEAVAIAARAALRAAPYLIGLEARSTSKVLPAAQALVFYRCKQIGFLAAHKPSQALEFAAANAFQGDADVAAKSLAANDLVSAQQAFAAYDASAYVCACVAYPLQLGSEVDWEDQASSVMAASDAFVGMGIAFWNAVNADLENLRLGQSPQELFATPLFDGAPPKEWEQAKSTFLTHLSTLGLEADFMYLWYDTMLTDPPRPMNWDLQEKIALIDDEIWKGEPKDLALEIASQVAQFEAERPFGETVDLDPSSGLFRITPVNLSRPDLLRVALDRIRAALKIALRGNGGLSTFDTEALILETLLESCRDDPQRVEMDCMSVVKRLNDRIETAESDTGPLEHLKDVCLTSALDLRSGHPDIAAARKDREQQLMRELSQERLDSIKKGLEAQAPTLVEGIEEGRREEVEADFRALINDYLDPLPTGAPLVPAPDPLVRLTSRVSRISMYQRSKEVLEAVKGSPYFLAAEVTLAASGIIALLIQLIG